MPADLGLLRLRRYCMQIKIAVICGEENNWLQGNPHLNCRDLKSN